jgi:hypothetical protein
MLTTFPERKNMASGVPETLPEHKNMASGVPETFFGYKKPNEHFFAFLIIDCVT